MVIYVSEMNLPTVFARVSFRLLIAAATVHYLRICRPAIPYYYLYVLNYI